jgi:hypothetical protein
MFSRTLLRKEAVQGGRPGLAAGAPAVMEGQDDSFCSGGGTGRRNLALASRYSGELGGQARHE